MINYLVLERRLNNQAPFSEQSASELLANYRVSLPFAFPEWEPNLLTPTEKSVEDKPVSVSSITDDQPKMNAISVAEGERELTTGLLSRDASFRLIVSGKVGEKEIDRLIRKLQLDKEILADREPTQAPD